MPGEPTCDILQLCLDWGWVDFALSVFWALFVLLMLAFMVGSWWATRRPRR
jgi:hypothetical protein